MNTSLEHLPEHKQKQLREITGIIVKAVDPEKVILFGSHATGRWVEHRYTEGGITYEYISDYDILVITKSGESRKDYEVQDVMVILGLLIYQGLAAEEITRLEATHVHLREGRLFVRAMKRTGERWLPLSALQLIELGEYLQENRFKTGPLLVDGRKQPASPTNINNRMQGMMKQLRRLNPRVINAAQFRSSVIAHWLKANNLRQVQYMAGHKYVSSTQRYQLSTLDDLKSELQQHHPLR